MNERVKNGKRQQTGRDFVFAELNVSSIKLVIRFDLNTSSRLTVNAKQSKSSFTISLTATHEINNTN